MDSKDYAILVLVGQVPFITQLNRQPHEALRQNVVNLFLQMVPLNFFFQAQMAF